MIIFHALLIFVTSRMKLVIILAGLIWIDMWNFHTNFSIEQQHSWWFPTNRMRSHSVRHKNFGNSFSHDLPSDIAARKFFLRYRWNRSNFPLLLAKYGETRVCLIPHVFRKFSNSALTNCLPLSETNSSGKPNLAKISVRTRMTSREVICHSMCASGYDE